MKTCSIFISIMAIVAAAPQYRPIAPLASVIPRAPITPITPLTARTPIASISPLNPLAPLAPISPLLSSAVSSPLKVAGVRDDPSNAIILRFENDNNGIDGYSYAVETSDGQFKEEQGQLINPGIVDAESIAVRGQYSYIAPDGVLYTVTYIADENGFQPHAEQVARTI